MIALGEARAIVLAAAKNPELRRTLGPVISEVDRAIATLDPVASGSFDLTPLTQTVPPHSTSEMEALRREAERLKMLAEQERGLLETLLMQSPHGILVCDVQGKLILQNRASERIWAGSATADDVEGWGRFRAYHEDGRPYEAADWSMARCLSRRETIEAEEVHFQRFDGTHGILLGSCAPILGRNSELLGAVSIFADITHFKQVEEALRVSEAWLSTTLRSIGDAVIATDTEGRIKFMNPVAESLTGWSIQDAKERPLSEIFRVLNKITHEEVESPAAKVLRDGVVVGTGANTILVRRDGSKVIIDDSGAPIRDDRGELLGVVLVFRDMTEKARGEERRELLIEAGALLAKSRMNYEKTLADLAKLAVPRIADFCAIDIVETEGSMRRVAVACISNGKLELAEDLGRWFSPDPDMPWSIHNVLQTGQPEINIDASESMLAAIVHDPEYLALLREQGLRSVMIVPMYARNRPLGAITFLSASAKRSFGPDDRSLAEEIAGRAAIAMDNALLYQEARRAETEAHRNAARMNTLAEASRSFSEAGIDFGAVVSVVAHRVAELVGDGCVVRLLSENGQWLDPVASYHSDPEAISFVHDVVAGGPIRADEGVSGQALRMGEAVLVPRAPLDISRDAIKPEHRPYLDRYGTQSVVIAPLRVPGRTIGTLSVFRDRPVVDLTVEDQVLVQDVADRAALAIENARLHQQTREAAGAREDLLAIVSHDLRNPLGVVVMSSAILFRMATPDKQGEQIKKHAEKIERSAKRMESLIANLLDATRIDAGRFDVEFKPHDIGVVIGESVDLLRDLAGPKSIHLTKDVWGGMPTVFCDRERILQVLGNLVGNAIKFTPEGGTITVHAEPAEGHVLVSVTDTGPGIPDEYVPHIFERYWKGKRQGRTGTGLGLYIAKGIVDAHSGRIWLESKVGVGSTFFFTIPIGAREQVTAG